MSKLKVGDKVKILTIDEFNKANGGVYLEVCDHDIVSRNKNTRRVRGRLSKQRLKYINTEWYITGVSNMNMFWEHGYALGRITGETTCIDTVTGPGTKQVFWPECWLELVRETTVEDISE